MFFHDRWPIFHEDNHLLVLYKPSGLIIQRDHKNKANLLDLVKFWIKDKYAKPGNVFAGMVHRLDGPVAGLVVVAKTSKAASRLSEQFRLGRVEKQYMAVVEGRPARDVDRLEDAMVRAGRLSRIADRGSAGVRTAILRYQLRSRHQGRSLLSVTLETGRRHQIRLQLSHLGCPIVGDVNYGATAGLPNGRIALIAHRLAFDHPTRALRLHFELPIPVGWPWPDVPGDSEENRPLWTIEEFVQAGLVLPDASMPQSG